MSDHADILFWYNTAKRLAVERRPRRDSYEASLTIEERTNLYARILAGTPLDQVQTDCPKWKNGLAVSLKVIFNISSALRKSVAIDQRLQRLLSEMEETAALVQRLRNQCSTGQNRDRLDAVIGLMGDAAVQMAAGGQVDKTLIGVAGLLLKRQDQVDNKAKFDADLAGDLDKALAAVSEEMKDAPDALALIKAGFEKFREAKAA